MIVTSYTQFRDIFSTSTSYDADGMKHFDHNNVEQFVPRFNLTSSPVDFPFQVLASNAYTSDATYGVDEYDWYLSNRVHDGSFLYLYQLTDGTMTSYSGKIYMEVNPDISHLIPAFAQGGAMTQGELYKLFNNSFLWCHRVSDHAVDCIDLWALLVGG